MPGCAGGLHLHVRLVSEILWYHETGAAFSESGMNEDSAGASTRGTGSFLVEAVFRRKFRIIVFLLLLAGFLGIRIVGMDGKYRSRAVFSVTTIGDYIFQKPDYFSGDTVVRTDADRDFMDEVETLGSRSLAEAVVRDIGVKELSFERESGSPFVAGVRKLAGRFIPGDPERAAYGRGASPVSGVDVRDFDRAVRNIMESTDISADTRNRTIRITVCMSRPFPARDVLSGLVRKYQETRSVSGGAPDSYALLSQKADSLSAELAGLDSELVRLRYEWGALNSRYSRTALEEKRRRLDHDLAMNELAMIAVRSRIEARENLTGMQGESSRGGSGSGPDSTRALIFARRGSPGKSEQARVAADTDFLRGAKLDLAADYLSRVRLQAESMELRQQLDRLEVRLRAVVLLEDSLKLFTDKRSEVERRAIQYSGSLVPARINHLLQQERFPLVRMVSPASPPKPVPFSRTRGAAAGMLLGIVLSCGYAIAAEYMHPRMKTDARQRYQYLAITSRPHMAPARRYLPPGNVRVSGIHLPGGDEIYPISPEGSPDAPGSGDSAALKHPGPHSALKA